MPLVKAHYACCAVAIGKRNECAIGKSQAQVCVAHIKGDDLLVVLTLEAGDVEAALGKVSQEC